MKFRDLAAARGLVKPGTGLAGDGSGRLHRETAALVGRQSVAAGG